MGKKFPMHCQGKKQKSTEILGKVVKPQQRTSLNRCNVDTLSSSVPEYFHHFENKCFTRDRRCRHVYKVCQMGNITSFNIRIS